MPKKLIIAVVVIFVVFFIVTSPDKSAQISQNAWKGIVHIAHGLSTFVGKL